MPVPGEGPQPALGMIVGEAPGPQEEKEGRPFVGRSGKLLDTALRSVGLERESLYVTNVVKVVPLDDEGKIRRPKEAEIEEWAVTLDGEIHNTAPRAILALGQTASKAICRVSVPAGSKIGIVYTAWHPAFVLRQRSLLDEWIKQLRLWAEAVQADA